MEGLQALAFMRQQPRPERETMELGVNGEQQQQQAGRTAAAATGPWRDGEQGACCCSRAAAGGSSRQPAAIYELGGWLSAT